jgi:hypothetical protein
METEYFRMWRAQHPEADGTKVGELHRKKFEEADRRLERATTSLATLKRLLPKTIEVQVIQKPVASPSPAPIVSGLVNGDHGVGNTQNLELRNSVMSGAARPVNRLNGVAEKLNGHHNQIDGILEHAAVPQ